MGEPKAIGMSKNHKVIGTAAFYVNDVLHSVLEYETAYQRLNIIDDFTDKVKHIKNKVTIYYVISIDVDSLPCHKKPSFEIHGAAQVPSALTQLQIQKRAGRYRKN